MIFVSVGTSDQPFDRLLHAVSPLCSTDDVVVQYGPSAVRPAGAECVAFLGYDELLERMRGARAVVTHAGVGSVMSALSVGKRPFVVPRMRSFGEAVDDHQLELAVKLDEAGLVRLVSDPAALPEALTQASAAMRNGSGGTNRLVEDLRRYILDRVRS